jgi:hypothetical protein
MPFFSFATKYFDALHTTADERPVWRIWVSNHKHSTLINPAGGRVYGYVWHDRKANCYYPMIVLPLWRALPLIFARQGWVASLMPFPRVGLHFPRKRLCAEYARWFVEHVLDGGSF